MARERHMKAVVFDGVGKVSVQERPIPTGKSLSTYTITM
jgi:hypothetical protein